MLTRNDSATRDICDRIRELLDGADRYEAIKEITRSFLGTKKLSEDRYIFGFWVPGAKDGYIRDYLDSVYLELLTPKDRTAIVTDKESEIAFDIDRIHLDAVDDYMVVVLDGVPAGSKDKFGLFYWVKVSLPSFEGYIRDPLAVSLPFGVYAPAELFDIDSMLSERRDRDYFTTHYDMRFDDGSYRAKDIGMCLEIHTETATPEGSIAGLTRRYKKIAGIMRDNEEAGKPLTDGLNAKDLNWIGFDTIELMPEVPTSERQEITGKTGEFFIISDESDREITVTLKRPDISNWGYDTPVLGSAAVSPSILETLRPNEMLEFIETIHTMPGRPIQLCIDSVLGHCDFQGAFLLETYDREPVVPRDPKYIHSRYLSGHNMYGRDIDFSHPNVRAMLIELLRRKIDLGYDCIRVDGAQDFIKGRDEETGLRIQDDVFLRELVSVEQNICGIRRRLDINLEDGRPWPDDLNWMYNSKYLDHSIEMTLPGGIVPKQWSPIIFAHNVHGKFKWFMEKWDRFVEVYRYGQHWITGQSNHDNARYFYKMVSSIPSIEYSPGTPYSEYHNDQLGKNKKEIVHNAMDHNALSGLMLAFLPGHPMFLLNSLVHTPWMFLRDIDDTYSVAILAGEGTKFFEWYVDRSVFERRDNFPGVKAFGFNRYEDLMMPVNSRKSGFLNRLYELSSRVKTDAVAVRYLFETPKEAGHYSSVNELKAEAERIISSRKGEGISDRESKADMARKLLYKNRKVFIRELEYLSEFLSRENLNNEFLETSQIPQTVEDLKLQIEKIDYLLELTDRSLSYLLEHASNIDAYDLDSWARDPILNSLASERLKENGLISPRKLKAFARTFMRDARDACKVHKYEDALDQERVAFNYALRTFRTEHDWLKANPTNDIRRDYFARKLFINGAKDIGDWGDKGDNLNCNTIYYGWRTAPDDSSQIFFIANMEGKPIDSCPLDLFLNLSGEWKVALSSPSIGKLPRVIDRSFRLKNFRNGEVLVLEKIGTDSIFRRDVHRPPRRA